jgi:hypothetical protein
MLPFNLEIELENTAVTITVEQLERFADIDGYTRYDVRTGERCSVIYVNVEYEPPVLVTSQDVESYFEALHYPEQLLAYNDEDLFTPEELKIIACAILQHNKDENVAIMTFPKITDDF